jgi:(1->4)-alpha-D-glucan 1-alpha-D-glucosylmutase
VQLYQALVAVWPPRAPSRAQLNGLRERLHAYMEKAAREAGRNTSWSEPDRVFEGAMHAFIDAVLAPSSRAFLGGLTELVARIAWPGYWGSLARLVLQLASPGVPDVYQGDELWTFTLVDPDNRRPVDFSARRRSLAALARVFPDAGAHPLPARALAGLIAHPDDGRIKLHVLHQGLRLRRRAPELFSAAEYLPLRAGGRHARHVVAFARRVAGRWAVAVVPRLVLTLMGSARAPIGPDVWGDTHVVLPTSHVPKLRSAFTGDLITPARRGGATVLACADLLARFPVALASSF